VLTSPVRTYSFLSPPRVLGEYAGDGNIKGEIETFLSRAGHVTDFHSDYMENFTLQLVPLSW
jgi:hypothetical protein